MDKLTMTEIAARLGMSRQRLYYIVTNRKKWTIEDALLLEEKSEGRWKAKQFIPDIKARIKEMVKAL
jgi:hypothetical protein